MKTNLLIIPLFALGVAGFTAKMSVSKSNVVHTVSAQQSDPLMESMNKMMKEMHELPMNGNIDLDFASMLRVHHKGAVDMSKIEVQQGKDAIMKKMAQKIIDKQSKEITQLDQLIASLQNAPKNYDPANKQNGPGKSMNEGMMSMMKMGKMSMSSVDHEFADMMVKHHKDGIMMSKAIVAYSKTAKLKSMGKMGITDQSKDIREMQQWMASHK